MFLGDRHFLLRSISSEAILGLMLVVNNPDPKQYLVKHLRLLVPVHIFVHTLKLY